MNLCAQAYTYWAARDSFKNPSNPAELAAACLFEVAFQNLSTQVADSIAGAEWWVQRRSGDSGISFHFDKDEGIASEHSWMKMPMFSTVTCVFICDGFIVGVLALPHHVADLTMCTAFACSYMTDIGSPTMIFNQTTDRFGNSNVPIVPSEVVRICMPPVPSEGHFVNCQVVAANSQSTQQVLAFPKPGYHAIFRGNLNHGVASLDWLSQTTGERWTFLINWWDQRPIEPYCRDLKYGPGSKVMRKHHTGAAHMQLTLRHCMVLIGSPIYETNAPWVRFVTSEVTG